MRRLRWQPALLLLFLRMHLPRHRRVRGLVRQAITSSVQHIDFGGVETNWDIASGQTPATYYVTISSLSIAPGGYIATPYASSYQSYGLGVGDGTTQATIVGKGAMEIRNFDIGAKYNVAGVLTATDSSTVRILPSSKAGGVVAANGSTVVFGDQTKDVTTLNLAIPLTINGPDVSLYFLSACAQIGQSGSNLSVTCLQEQPTTYAYSGKVTVNSSTNLAIQPQTTVNMTGTVTGADKLVKASGSGVLNIGGVKVIIPATSTTYEGVKDTESITVKENETATLLEGATRSSAMVEYGGVLKGKGILKYSLIINVGGMIAPGNSPGCLTSDTLSLYGTYQFELGGTDPCTGYDQLVVKNAGNLTHAVDIGDTTAVLSTSRYNNYTPKQGQVFVIINQAGTAAVSGTFKGLAEGATFTQNGVLFKISYKGGDGNDVTLTVMNKPTAPNTGFAILQANPVMTAAAAVIVAGVLFLLGRKLQSVRH